MTPLGKGKIENHIKYKLLKIPLWHYLLWSVPRRQSETRSKDPVSLWKHSPFVLCSVVKKAWWHRMDRESNGTGLSVLKYACVSVVIFFIREPRRGKNDLFNKWCWDKGIARCKRMTLGSYLNPYTEVSSKWINDLNINYKSLWRKLWRQSLSLGFGSGFLDVTPKA